MKTYLHHLCGAAVIAVCAAFGFLSARADTPSKGFQTGKGTFMLEGQPFVIKAAELHYPRIPKPYWEHRIKMSKALGMNTICLYVFWNFHEAAPGEFDFSGQRNLREFIELCASNDMKVILRPGPYVCAEWEMGGLPWWLLKDREVQLREQDPRFMERVDLFMQQVAEQTKGLMDKDGGPIIMVQVENEYGSYGKNKPYVAAIRDMLRKYFGEETVLFQCDWSSNFLDNGLDDLIWTMNFGTGADIDSQFAELKRLRPDTPLMCSEFWSGWFDKWGASHETRQADDMIAGISEMLDKNISFSLYMTHGGTNWGHWAGANSPGYAPDVTSYDYDAPITEYGTVTPKYMMLRDLLGKYSDTALPDIPESLQVISIDAFTLDSVAPLWDNLPASVRDTLIRPMEMYDQGFGSIIYSFEVPEDGKGIEMFVNEPRDFAQIFLDGRKIGTLDRRKGETYLPLGDAKKGSRIDVLVEAMGRINFGRAIKDYKGVDRDIRLVCQQDTFIPLELNVTLLPDDLNFYNSLNFTDIKSSSNRSLPPGVYKGTFNLSDTGDTFLDMSSWGKGLVYVNGHDIGRFWEIGPQQTLYIPGCWLKEGENEVVVFDILGPQNTMLQGLEQPIIDKLNQPSGNHILKDIKWPEGKPAAKAKLPKKNGWRTVKLASPTKGRLLYLEVTKGHAPEAVSIAELQLFDSRGNELPNENWRIEGVSSEDILSGNHTADKLFDHQESTYWRSVGKTPQTIVIDLGADYEVGSLRILPRMESGAPEAPSALRVALGDK